MTIRLRPKLVEGIFIYQDKGRTLILNPKAPDWISVGDSYRDIFDLFNGDNDISQIEFFVKHRYLSDNPDLLITQINNLLLNSKIFSHNWVEVTSSINDYMPIPKYIYLTLTDSCNLACSYCYAKERVSTVISSLTQWQMYIDKILRVSNEITFTFTGGEPLLVPFVFDLARYVSSKTVKPIILTNGTMIAYRKVAKEMAECFSQIRISLDSINSDSNTLLRGPGVLEKVEEAVKLLEEVGADYLVVPTITQINKDEVGIIANHFSNKVSFQPLYKMGSSRDCPELAISGLEYYEALSTGGVFSFLPGYRQNIHCFRNNPYKRCAMASEELSIGPNGDLFPCHLLHYSDYKIGNLNIDDPIELYFSSEKLKNLRNISVDSITHCKECPVRNFCGAACRARIDVNEYGLDGVDKFCVYEKESILEALIYSFG